MLMGNYLRMFNKSPGPVAPCQSWAGARSGACRLERPARALRLGRVPLKWPPRVPVKVTPPGFLVQEPQKKGPTRHRCSLGPGGCLSGAARGSAARQLPEPRPDHGGGTSTLPGLPTPASLPTDTLRGSGGATPGPTVGVELQARLLCQQQLRTT